MFLGIKLKLDELFIKNDKTMIRTRQDLKEYLFADSHNYKSINNGFKRYIVRINSNPISDQWYIWKYIRTMRILEYHLNVDRLLHKCLAKYWLYKLRNLAYKTGFQIPPNTCGKGLTIWHWGPIIINPEVRLGDYCTLQPMIEIGHKEPGEGVPIIGNNVTISAGVKIIGNVKIGDNVILAPNAAVANDIPNNSVAGGVPAKVLRLK